MKKRIVLLNLVMMMAGCILAQTAKIMGFDAKGFVVEIEGNDAKNTFLSVNVNLQYGKFAEEDGCCVVVMSKNPFPMITSVDQLKAAMEKYDIGAEVLDEAPQTITSDVEVYVPFEVLKTTESAQTLYLQTLIMYGQDTASIMAKSQVKKVNVKDLTIVDMFRSEEDIEKISGLFSAAVSMASGGDGDCPFCHGKGEVEEKASYGSYTRTCYYCDGTGQSSSATDGGKTSSGSGGDLLELFFGAFGSEGESYDNTKTTKQTKGKTTKQTNKR